MNRVVVITAMCSRYPEDKPEGTEIWAVNRSFTVEPRVDRVYFFDPHTLFTDGFIEEVDALGVPVYTRDVMPEIAKSVKYPLEEIVRYFNKEYSTSTVAWMIQHAIYEHLHGEPIDKLVLNGMYHPRDSVEYLWALPCINYWVGIAAGCGMKVQCYGFNAIALPMPWETGCYGYRRNIHAQLCIDTLSAAYKACYSFPKEFKTADEELCPPEDRESLVATRDKLNWMMDQVNLRLEKLPQ